MSHLEPIATPPPLGRDSVRLHTDRSVGLVIFGAIALASTLGNAIPWLLSSSGARFPSDYDLVALATVGTLAALAIIARGITGTWSSTDLPRVQLSTGLLHVVVRGKRVAYPLAELREVVITDTRERIVKQYQTIYSITATNLPEPIAKSARGSRILPRYAKLRTYILAAKLREQLATPDGGGDAFRSYDPMARAKEILDDDAPEYRDPALALLARDHEPIVARRAAELRSPTPRAA